MVTKVIQLHQWYRSRGGEDAMVDATFTLLRERGIGVRLVDHSSRRLVTSLSARMGAFVSGIYSFSASAVMRGLIIRERPDVVHVHNLHPLFSPSVLVACRQADVPVVMTCHNYRLVCPAGMHMRAGEICELCLNGREYWCALTNCKGNMFESVGYALRNAVHRKLRLFVDNVSVFVAISHFVQRRLTEGGFPTERIAVVPNMVVMPSSAVDCSKGTYVAFAGRFSPQKGIGTVLEAARYTKLPLRLAGDYSPMLRVVETASREATFVGSLSHDQMALFYSKARFVVVPSNCLEPFGLVAAEAMSYGLPVIASRVGGLPEIVDDGVTGLLFERGNAKDLAAKMMTLWESPSTCHRMGSAGREKFAQEYCEDVYFGRLMAVYEKAIEISKEKTDIGVAMSSPMP